MFIAEFKRAYERELLINPDLQRFVVNTDPNKNKIINQRDYITSSSYRTAKRKTKRNNKLISTSSKDPRAWNSDLRELLGGTANTNSVTTRKGIITGNDSPTIKAAKYRRTINDRVVPTDNIRNTFSNWNNHAKQRQLWSNPNRNVPDPWNNKFTPTKNSTTIARSNFAPKQQLALPPARNMGNTIMSTQGLRQPTSTKTMGNMRRAASTQTMGNVRRTTSPFSTPHTPVKQSGANKFLIGGVVAGAGLLGAGAYSLYQRNRNNKDKNKR